MADLLEYVKDTDYANQKAAAVEALAEVTAALKSIDALVVEKVAVTK